MGRDVRKLPAAMEAGQVVGVRTRARTLALAAAVVVRKGGSKRRSRRARAAEVQISCVQIRSRNVGASRSKRCSSPEMGRISRCSSNASCEMLEGEEELRLLEDDEGLKASGALREIMERRETAQSNKHREELGDVESTVDGEHVDLASTAEQKISAASADAMPSQAEIDDFFTTAEAAQKRRFSDKYNYDVDSDAPLDGHFEWVLIKPRVDECTHFLFTDAGECSKKE